MFLFMALNVSGLTMMVRGRGVEGDIGGELGPSRKHGLAFGGGPEFWCSEVLTCFCWSPTDTVSALDPP